MNDSTSMRKGLTPVPMQQTQAAPQPAAIVPEEAPSLDMHTTALVIVVLLLVVTLRQLKRAMEPIAPIISAVAAAVFAVGLIFFAIVVLVAAMALRH